MCREAPRDIIEFEHMGVIFYRGEDGKLGTRAFGGASQARTYFVGDITGQALLVTLYDQILKAGVKVYEEWFATRLYMEDGACRGVVALEMVRGELHLLRAKAVIVAAGGLGRVYEPSTNALICTGDGYSLAYRAGAPLMDMEMVQYHPTTLAGSGFLMTEAARGEGAYLLNSQGERFMKEYAPNKMELAARDVISRAEATEIAEGRGIDGNVLLDLRHLGADVILKKLPQIHEMALDYLGIDMIKEPVPVRPGMHYQMGGIKTDVDGATSSPACTPPAKSPASASTAATGSARTRCSTRSSSAGAPARRRPATRKAHRADRAARIAARRAAASRELLARPYTGETHARLRLELGDDDGPNVGVYRDDAGLHEALEAIDELEALRARRGRRQGPRLQSGTDLRARARLSCSTAPKRSCAARSCAPRAAARTRDRLPRPQRRRVAQTHRGHLRRDGEPEISYLPVTITQWKPEVRTY